MFRVLSLGNSFSQDAHTYLPKMAMDKGYRMEFVNLYIGGCDLKKHWELANHNLNDYLLEENAVSTGRYVSFPEMLELHPWEIITFQQASHFSGKPQSYLPYIDYLGELARQARPYAQLYFHQTWAYETDSDHWGFKHYNYDQEEMHRRICDAAEMTSNLLDAPIIPVGDIIQQIRINVPEFDYRKSGLSLCRDGFHLSLDYGRFAASATWFRTLTGELPRIDTYDNMDKALLEKIIAVIDRYFFEK